jgi:hypothetical protein
MGLSTDQMRALRLLDGCTEAIMLAHGFKSEMLAGLVGGLASVVPGSMRA